MASELTSNNANVTWLISLETVQVSQWEEHRAWPPSQPPNFIILSTQTSYLTSPSLTFYSYKNGRNHTYLIGFDKD
jgi:hypothetical protein